MIIRKRLWLMKVRKDIEEYTRLMNLSSSRDMHLAAKNVVMALNQLKSELEKGGSDEDHGSLL